MKHIDMTGQACPIPVVEAKKALSSPEARGIAVLVDNKIAVQNLEKMAAGLGYALSSRETGAGLYDVEIQKETGTEEIDRHNIYYGQLKAEKTLVVVIGSDELGGGEPELGKILMKSFIYSLSELDKVPSSVIFLNKGAYLTAAGSNALPDLKILEQKGAEILTCGTCSDYYGLENRIEAGSIIDMYGIAERMAHADTVINL